MEAGLAPDAVSVGVEGHTLAGDGFVEIGEAVEVPVDDRLVEVDPQGLGGLELGGAGGRKTRRIPSGMTRPGERCQPALSSTSTMIRSRPAPASRAKTARMASKSSLETPVERYQKLSPVLGETKTVT